jgi:hypothetical protein
MGRARRRRSWARHSERFKAKAREAYARVPEEKRKAATLKKLAYMTRWHEQNRARSHEIKRAYIERNRELHRKRCRSLHYRQNGWGEVAETMELLYQLNRRLNENGTDHKCRIADETGRENQAV